MYFSRYQSPRKGCHVGASQTSRSDFYIFQLIVLLVFMTNNNVNEIKISELETVAVISYHKIVRGLYFRNIYLVALYVIKPSVWSKYAKKTNLKSESINKLSPGTVCLEKKVQLLKMVVFAGNFKRKSVKSRYISEQFHYLFF